MRRRPRSLLTLSLLMLAFAPLSHAGEESALRAVVSDPPKDGVHPARMQSLQIISHDKAINAVFYLASGSRTHPTVLLLHGSPGNEQNLDLAQAIRRAGWNTLTLHYRGSWGSAGQYSLAHSIEDSETALAFLREPKNIQKYALQPGRIVVMGHSMGGFLCAKLGANDPSLMGIALLAAWDVGHDAPIMAKWSSARLDAEFGDMPGRVVGATGRSLVAEAVAHEKEWTLAAFAPGLAKHRVLIVTPHDDDRQSGLKLAATLKELGAPVTAVDMDTDHPFSDSRIALEVAVIRWLASLPNAPTAP